jgi:hypothetical protein
MDKEQEKAPEMMMPTTQNPGPGNGMLDPGQMTNIDPTKPIAKAGQRSRRRLDLDQLQVALTDATGLTWMEDRDGNEVNRFDELSETLGKPDFDGITHEELAPTTTFQRFLDEASLSICRKLLDNEQKLPQADRIFFVHASWEDDWASSPSRLMSNLQMLLLRYHGREYASDSEGIKPWVSLYQQAESASNGVPLTAWNTICVGLLTHPDFYTF